MTDAEIIDWLQRNATAFAEDNIGPRPFTLRYLNGSGREMYVQGANLRDCAIAAKIGDGAREFRG